MCKRSFRSRGKRLFFEQLDHKRLRFPRPRGVSQAAFEALVDKIGKEDGVKGVRLTQSNALIVCVESCRPASSAGKKFEKLTTSICNLLIDEMIANAEAKRQARQTRAAGRQKPDGKSRTVPVPSPALHPAT